MSKESGRIDPHGRLLPMTRSSLDLALFRTGAAVPPPPAVALPRPPWLGGWIQRRRSPHCCLPASATAARSASSSVAWGLLGVSTGDGDMLGWSLGVKEGAAWAGLEDGNRSWAPRAEDGAIWGIAVSPAGPAVDSVSRQGGRLRA